ncbi:hypothetical protein [Alkalilimnicola ehrlichii]|uniref:hypothetical protein n=1 Tax=Alkalilimnicola ehrlichii TaxID=351052 RepID=UPI0011C02EAB|nr:hypothetical protein [Alkalilimnicola ehrlichii]
MGNRVAIVGGNRNRIEADTGGGSARGATVLGGASNTASEQFSVAVGGWNNRASGDHSVVVGGGQHNEASGPRSVVLGGGGTHATDAQEIAP